MLAKVRSKYPEIPISLLLILQGFGIAQPQQVKEALQLGAAGAISGSATVKIIERNLHNHPQCLAELAEFVQKMKRATQ
ncbi:Tryptophan synthase alpha chain [Avibacterium paragallinarum]|uniref:tryptophan synthase n=1 Tax=Avibacterium paragallinarum TaxID=728 RepID=A0A0F5EYD8_AVIPA|nr:hypothetical protein Z012_06225 [Avibacterium paragallinarum]SUU97859.1 Tryptophan synthase alpha chain [Avibacterium paragallinarum]